MPNGLVLECPVCEDQRPFGIDPEDPPPLIKPRLKSSAKRHLEAAHDQDSIRMDQWETIIDTMFEADIPQELLDKLDDDSYRGAKWDNYELRQ